jgi:DNA helicase-2/ATP-dependent DNA helicase PcrA
MVYIVEYEKRYKKLNPAQKQAIDTIDGPLMVVAGPGTGKTELLSMRVANILRQTDVLPDNILCLTFTESAAHAMRQRLIDIIGSGAHKVSINTFHGFGTETINQNGQFFYNGADFKSVDELSVRAILVSIFDELEHDNLLSSKMNGKYTHLDDAIQVISELKKSGLTDEELRLILDKNDEVIEKIEPVLGEIFVDKVSKNTLISLRGLLPKIKALISPIGVPTITSLARVMHDSLKATIDNAETHPKTTPPLTAWKNNWLKLDHTGTKKILKSSENQKKLRSLSYVYFKYLNTMREKELYDYDDMILDVLHAIETSAELKATLQEKYQYIMVDEFQDTNLAQMRIIYNLTDNLVNEGRPNIMIVGDDDQAIFSFHGADIGNILHFKESYKDVAIVTLKENYRSTTPILSFAREVILQGNIRLENSSADIDKTLLTNSKEQPAEVKLLELESVAEERALLISSIKSTIKAGESPNQITVIARRHKELVALLPYFTDEKMAVNYERQDNILDNELIILIENVARVIVALQIGDHRAANVILSEIVGHPVWNFSVKDIWRFSLKAYNEKLSWLEIMEKSEVFSDFQAWLIELSAKSSTCPLERMLDEIIGTNIKSDKSFNSPIFSYYFSDDKLTDSPEEYVICLESLRAIRVKLKEYAPLDTPTLKDFVEFIELNRSLGSGITNIRPRAENRPNAINLMTAHRAKGLEFNNVYIINAVDNIWGEKSRVRGRSINYPENLPIAMSSDNLDERLRLFFVASTRAKKKLTISYSTLNEAGKETFLANFLTASSLNPTHQTIKANQKDIAEKEWYGNLLDLPVASMKEILSPILENFKLSATHINSFIDLERGGPQHFLINNLLRFPQAMTESAAYGTAIHKTIQKAHNHLVSTGKRRPIEDLLTDFELFLKDQRLQETEYKKSLQKGIEHLQVFLGQNYDSFSTTQKTELSFVHQQVQVDGANLNGQLDLVDIDTDKKTIKITDYKTGKPASSWKSSNAYEQIKLHKYRQQLIFYRMLIENSRDYSKYSIKGECLSFVQPDKSNRIVTLEAEFADDEIVRFKTLVTTIWKRILSLDLPDITKYDKSLKGILAFEQDLIDSNI